MKIETKNIQWTTTSGHKIRVSIYEGLGQAATDLYINGKSSMEYGSSLTTLSIPKIVRGVECVGTIGPVGLEKSTHDQIKACIEDIDAEISKKPEVILNRLIEVRAGMKSDVSFWIKESVDQDERFIIDASLNGFSSEEKSNKSEIEKAKAALSSFDGLHPEVLSEINKRSDEAHERFMASN